MLALLACLLGFRWGAALARVSLCWLCVRFRTARVASCHGRDKSNAQLDVPIVMPKHADGSSKSKDTEDTTRFELDSCWTGADVHVHIDKVSWHTGKTEASSEHTVEYNQSVGSYLVDYISL